MTLLDDVKKEVDASVWCDSIEWRGKRVTLRRRLDAIPLSDPSGSQIVEGWKRELDDVHPRYVRVVFQMKQYGCHRAKMSRLDPTSVKTCTHCWAIFEVVVR